MCQAAQIVSCAKASMTIKMTDAEFQEWGCPPTPLVRHKIILNFLELFSSLTILGHLPHLAWFLLPLPLNKVLLLSPAGALQPAPVQTPQENL